MELLFIIAAAFALAHSLFDEAFFVHSETFYESS